MATTKSLTTKDMEEFAKNFIFNEGDAPQAAAPKKKVPAKPDFNKLKKGATTIMDAEIPDGTTIMKYSKLFGWDKKVLKELEDFDVVVFERARWSEDEQAHIPEMAQFDDRVVDHRAMYPFVLGMQPKFRGFKIMMVGPTGSGKSTLAEYYCGVINQPFLRINGRQDMESDSLLGRPWVSPEGGMEYLLGEWPKATKAGWFVLVDEPWKIPSGIWMTAQRHLERGGIWQLDDIPSENTADKQIVPKNTYRCVLADNVVGTGDNVEQFGATMIQDSSTLNRIDMVIQVPYLEAKEEVSIITKKYPQIPEHMATKMVSMLNLLRAGFDSGELSSPASIRNIEAWAEMSIAVNDYSKAFEWVLLNRYADDSEIGAVRNHYSTCFGNKLGS